MSAFSQHPAPLGPFRVVAILCAQGVAAGPSPPPWPTLPVIRRRPADAADLTQVRLMPKGEGVERGPEQEARIGFPGARAPLPGPDGGC